MTPRTYRQVEKAIGKTYPRRMVFVLAPWPLYGPPHALRSEIAPLPQRILYRLTRRSFERRHRAAFGQ
jgi:hypothetical protein